MKRYHFRFVLIAMFCIGISTSAESEKGTDNAVLDSVTVTGPGTVYLYGELQPGPTYTVTGVGGKVLFLNGKPIHPLHATPQLSKLSPAERARIITQAKATHTANRQRYAVLKDMHEQGASDEDILTFMADAYRAGPEVVEVKICSHSILVTYVGGEMEEFILPAWQELPEKTAEERYAFHMGLIERFRTTIERGGLAAYGVANDSLQYSLFAPPEHVRLMEERQLFQKLAQGQVLTTDDVVNTPLSNEGFRIDMTRVARNVFKK